MAVNAAGALSQVQQKIIDVSHEPTQAEKSNFSDWFSSQIEESNNQIVDADINLRKMAMGDVDSMHQVMLSLEKAKISFELVVQVRNRLLEGYQELLRMQV